MESGTTAISLSEHFDARRLRIIAVARIAKLARAGRMAGCGTLGTPSGASRIGGVDHRNEEHRIGFVLPDIDPFFCEVAKS